MKKRIIFVISSMSVGGAQRSLINALKILNYDKYDVTLYVRQDRTDILLDVPDTVRIIVNKNKADYDHFPVALFYELIKRGSRLINSKKAEEFAQKKTLAYIIKKKTAYEKRRHPVLTENYDIAVSYLQGYVCKFTADCVNAKQMICFFHNSTDSLPQVHREYLPKYDKIVTVTENTRQFLMDKYPCFADRFVVIPNIVNVEEIEEKSTAFKPKKNIDRITLCTCGRMSPEKGYDLAVKAAEAINKQGIDFTWYFIGDGPEFNKIPKMIAECHLTNRIVMLGMQSNPYPWINACDIYVQPSYEEAQPLAIMEAQALGKPVVSTNTVGAQSLITDRIDGLLTPISADGIADGIVYLIKNKEEREKYVANLDYNQFSAYNDSIKKRWNELLA